MTVRCRVISNDGCTPSVHEFPVMPRVGNVFVFPGQYEVYEVADVLRGGILPVGGDTTDDRVSIVVRKKPAREVLAISA